MLKEDIYKMPKSVQEFLHYLNVVKNKSELTVLEYASDLRLFFRYRDRQSVLFLPVPVEVQVLLRSVSLPEL